VIANVVVSIYTKIAVFPFFRRKNFLHIDTLSFFHLFLST
jgi:hypothetical protein